MKSRAFTLIELLVVVLIIGILAAVALPQYQKAVLKSRYMQVQVLGRALEDAVNMYYVANGDYPITLDGLDINVPGTLSSNKRAVTVDNRYHCSLDVRSNKLDSLWCQLEPHPRGAMLAYRVTFYDESHKGNRYCVANAKNEEICKLVGGINPYDNGSELMHYKLP